MRRRLFATGIAALAIAASTMIATTSAATADTLSGGGLAGPTPNSQLIGPLAGIHVDDTAYKVVETLRGVGKQVYDCTGGKYVFREPMAGLFTTRGLPAGIHDAIPGTGPFWADFDGSKFVGIGGAGPVSVPSPVDPTKNIPWLKVSKSSTAGQGVLTNVELVQRTDTRGGVAPTTCGAGSAPTIAVDYTTWYVFWAPR